MYPEHNSTFYIDLDQNEYLPHDANAGLVPELHGPVPAGGGNLAGLVRVPERLDAHVVVRLPLGQQLGRLPVPDVALAVSVPGHEVAHLGGEVQAAGVARHHVTFEDLLADLLEPVTHLINKDGSQIFTFAINKDAQICYSQ